MVVVAIAGGTGGVGRTVLDAIAEAGEHQAIVLSRTVSLPIAIAFNAETFIESYYTRQQLPLQPTNRGVLRSIITTSSR